MTDTQLEKATELKTAIGNLKVKLSEAHAIKFFKLDDGNCQYMSRQADVFLSELDVEARTIIVNKIAERIKKLEQEFKEL